MDVSGPCFHPSRDLHGPGTDEVKAPIDPYPTRLVFEGSSGFAKHDGVRLDLTEAPQILPGVPLIRAISYFPHRGEVRASGEGWRVMTREECDVTLSWLARLSAAARQAA